MTDTINKIKQEFREKIKFLEIAGFDLEFLVDFLTLSLEKAIQEAREETIEEINMRVRRLSGQWEGETIEWRDGNKEAFRVIVNYLDTPSLKEKKELEKK